MRLVIVESPAKAKTINKYLGSDYKVIASYGHIRDLPSKQGSVDVENNFTPTWILEEKGEKFINSVLRDLKKCSELILATDPDREGEAISWHIVQSLQEKTSIDIPIKRIVFHEITKSAITSAVQNSRDIDQNLVDAYLARTILDYLVGFTLSPVLWRKLPGSKSAGRVQSVALRIIVDRESEIEKFLSEEYWSISGLFVSPLGNKFVARLIYLNGQKLEKFSLNSQELAENAVKDVSDKEYHISNIERKKTKRNPWPAFITSTLQQEASRKLGFGAKRTMSLAQKLYEGIEIDGEVTALITYMRTDSITLSGEAITNIRNFIQQKYDKRYLPDQPRVYKTKVKNAQEAHEAIRPVDPLIIPEFLSNKIDSDLFKLYDLIWKRAISSQMANAEIDQVQVDISDIDNKHKFRANGSTISFDGFLTIYDESSDEVAVEKNNSAIKDVAVDGKLPILEVDQILKTEKIDASQHFTIPPPRFSEASLVKKLEELGIGRPSTYANIIQVLQDRGYVTLEKKCFYPEMRGRIVTAFLVLFFTKYLEYDFTANLEQELDEVSNNTMSKQNVLSDFWSDFIALINNTKDLQIVEVLEKINQYLYDFLFPKKSEDEQSDIRSSQKCTMCDNGVLSMKLGKYGAFLGCSNYPECKFVKQLINNDFKQNGESGLENSNEYPKTLGIDPKTNESISLRLGPYGLYIQQESVPTPKRVAVPKTFQVGDITLEKAISLLAYPKEIGEKDGKTIKMMIGRFGPCLYYNGEYRAIPQKYDLEVFDLEQAIEILNSPKKVAKGIAKKKVLSKNTKQKKSNK